MDLPTGAPSYPAGTPLLKQADDLVPLEPVADQSPHLYVRHNLTDDGTTHAPPLSSSPDIIVKNNTVANPQDAFSIANSIASAMESDPYVRVDQANYVYLRIWNRGARAAGKCLCERLLVTARHSGDSALMEPYWGHVPAIGPVRKPDAGHYAGHRLAGRENSRSRALLLCGHGREWR